MSIRYAKATIIRVVDGDTVHTDLDIGWGLILRPRIGSEPNFGTLRICFPDGTRYDAPEASSLHGIKATSFVSTFVRPGDVLHVISHGLATDGRRTLASVTTRGGEDWATLMTNAGYVK